MKILAIDPGNIASAVVIMDGDTYRPLHAEKSENGAVLDVLAREEYDVAVIEMVASYGMPVGKTVFDTCVWIGRFMQASKTPVELIYRAEEKLAICHSPKANDATIRRALADRFAPGEKSYGKGTKKKPGWFFGFGADIWQAYAVAVTYRDKERGVYYVQQ